ncbi:hypothetical protein ACGFWD_26670 [Streptomyces sp. NPDC048448]|uniref:hypothetical protein n=1 Tax=unclassified Streptomyces TaxID=2593676 RepID=UPI00343868FD
MHAWRVISRDDPLVAELRAEFTVCRSRDCTVSRAPWVDVDPGEAWAACHDPAGWSGSIFLSADWDRVRITCQASEFHGTQWELRRTPVTVLVLSAWIGEDGSVTERPETSREAAWTEGFPGDWDRHVQRAAQWITSVPDPKDPFNYTQTYRFREASDRAVSRLKRWAYRQLATAGVPLQWDVQDHRISLTQGRYRTRVVLTGSDSAAVRAEWAGALAATRDQVLAEDRFRRAVNGRGTVVDVTKIKAGPSLLAKLRRQMAADRVPHPSQTPFNISSWVAWTCPDTGTERRGIVVGATRSSNKIAAVLILPADGSDEIEAHVRGDAGRLKSCGRIRKGEPGTVLPVPVPVAGDEPAEAQGSLRTAVSG